MTTDNTDPTQPPTPPTPPAGDSPPQAPPDLTKDKTQDRIVPEKYELKIPKDSLLGPEAATAVSEFAKANKLTNAEAQAVLEREHAVISSYVEGQKKQVEALTKAWFEEAKADKEIGGEAFNKNVELAKRFIEKYGPEDLRKELDATGLGNYPGLIKLIVRTVKAANFSEDTLVVAPNPPQAKKSIAERLYPDMVKA